MTINRIDMKDITDRVDELRGERETSAFGDFWAEEYPEEAAELTELEELLEELRGVGGDHEWEGDWYPRELIDVDSFEEYAEERASDCYDIPTTWPHRCIDWKQAAEELAQDYSMASFRGSDHYCR